MIIIEYLAYFQQMIISQEYRVCDYSTIYCGLLFTLYTI
jgi:hypothetical protein